MRAYIESYGCALNRGEAMEFESALRASGWEISDSPEDSNLNMIATCAVIETTELEMIKRAKHLSSLGRPLIVSGCMVSALRDRVEKAAPGAKFVPPDSIGELCKIAGIADSSAWTPEPWPGTHCHTIPIASGCLGSCAYCITKAARGDLRSRPVERIKGEIGRIDWTRGAKEIQLTAQDTASYGRDIGLSLPDLLREVASLEFDMKVRVGMMNPRTALPIIDELIQSFSSPRIFKFLHLPVQSASDRILREMGRGYSVGDFSRIVARFREAFPGITLSTDLIVGYPGETEEDHSENLRLMRTALPDIVNITRFSPRPGTEAEKLGGKVPGRIAKDRSRELTDLRFSISLSKNKAKVGRIVDVIVTENGTDGTMIGRTGCYEQVILLPGTLLGSNAKMRVVSCSPIHLIGEPE